jgi:hypothetical protein
MASKSGNGNGGSSKGAVARTAAKTRVVLNKATGGGKTK